MLPLSFRVSKNNGLISLLLAGFFFACSSGEKSTAKADQSTAPQPVTQPRDSILNLDNFSLFIPSGTPDSGTISLILFFDPQAEGHVPLKKYRSLARERKIVMAGSSHCKNGLSPETAMQLGRDFYQQLSRHFPQNKLKVYLSGFSGGAILASALCGALPDIQGLLYAAAPGIQVPACPAIGMTGMADPNFWEMEAAQDLIPQNVPHCIRYWKGKHAWPEPECMAFAFDWIAAREKKDETNYRKLLARDLGKMDIAEKRAALEARYFLSSSLRIAGTDSLNLAAFKNSPEFKKDRESRERAAKSEQQLKQFYRQAFFQKDVLWWKRETEKLRKAGPESWPEQRQLGFLSLMGWSLATKSLQQGPPEEAQRFVQLYNLIDQENPEPSFLQAILFARQGKVEQVKSSLKNALRLGFSDKNRFQNQPEFRGLGLDSIFLN